MTNTKSSTLTTRVAAIQLTMLHLQFRMKKIYEDQKALVDARPQTNRGRIRHFLPASYTFLDMLVSIQHVGRLIKDMFATPELRAHFDDETYRILNHTKKIAEKWRPVRNRLGGHIDICVAEDLCSRHGYSGVFLSDDLESDTAVLNLLLLESAMNSARSASDIIGRDLDMRSDLGAESNVLVAAINEDWNTIFSYFAPMMRLMYRAGKEEKKASTEPSEWQGIVRGD